MPSSRSWTHPLGRPSATHPPGRPTLAGSRGRPRPRRLPAALLLAALLLPAAARADVQITLQDAFVEKYKDRVTLDATFTVDRAQEQPGKPANGAGLRAAGRAPEIGLAAVAEMMSATSQVEAVNLVHAAERSGQPLALRGVWRLWCEQGGDAQEVQGRTPPAADSADPSHVFSLQPLLRVGGVDVGGAMRPLDSFTAKDAAGTFRRFEQLASHIVPGNGSATITTRMGGSGAVVFSIRLEEEPDRLLEDGIAVKAAILDDDGEVLVRERRILAAAGTAPYARLRTLHKGDTLHVAGLPRIDLSQIAWRLANSARVPGVLEWSLPYEMVLVAAYDEVAGAPPATTGAPGRSPGSAPDLAPARVAADPAAPAAGAASAPPDLDGAAKLPVAHLPPVAPAVPAGGTDGDVIVTLLQLLGQTLPADVVRGACAFSSGQRSYCGALSGPQCDQLGGAFNAGEDCPPNGPGPGPITPAPPGPAAPAAQPPPAQDPQPVEAAQAAPQAPPRISFLTTRPDFITQTTRRSAWMSCSGSPSTAMRSASIPGAMAPT
jgi:hypothetical protein